MPDIPLLLVVVCVLALVFDFINGFHDAANAIATSVSTRVLKPATAVVYSGILNLVGALMGTEVASTIGKGLIDPASVTLVTVASTMVAAIIWNLITWWKGLPTSSSHALIGSLLGATWASNGGISWDKVGEKVVLPMVTSPLLGAIIAFGLMIGLLWTCHGMKLKTGGRLFNRLQILSAGFMAFSHGRNDAQKSMGIMALALLLAYPEREFHVPFWVILSCALAMGIGTMTGGWRIINTLGSKMIRLQPIHGFAAETSAAMIIAGASELGIPVSTTQVISSAILGAGATRGFAAVRWGIVGRILWAWVLTLPLTFALAAGISLVFRS